MARVITAKVFLMIFMLITIVNIGGCTMPDNKSEEVKKGMEEYLKSKYGEEFTAEKPNLTGNAGFGYKVYQTYASPKEKPEIRFVVRWEVGDPGVYGDGYLYSKWTAEGEVEVAKTLKEVYGEDVPYIYDYYLSRYREDLLKPEEYKMTYKDTLEKYVNDSSTSISYVIFRDKELDKRIEAEKVYTVYKQLIYDNKILEGYTIHVYYIPQEYKKEFLVRFNKAKTYQTYDYSAEKLHEEGHLISFLSVFGVSKNHRDPIVVKSAEELIDQFKY